MKIKLLALSFICFLASFSPIKAYACDSNSACCSASGGQCTGGCSCGKMKMQNNSDVTKCAGGEKSCKGHNEMMGHSKNKENNTPENGDKNKTHNH